jgi:Na+/phosphate symporter
MSGDLILEKIVIFFFLGIGLILFGIYYVKKGELRFVPRYSSQVLTLNKEDHPTGFWILAGIWFGFGLLLVIVGIFYFLYG